MREQQLENLRDPSRTPQYPRILLSTVVYLPHLRGPLALLGDVLYYTSFSPYACQRNWAVITALEYSTTAPGTV